MNSTCATRTLPRRYYAGDLAGTENQFINVFDPNAVIAEDPFRPYARLAIAPNLIIIGTVNFDETTRSLSMRLLDRCNLLEFTVDNRLPVFWASAQTGTHQIVGQPVLQADRDRWTRNMNVPARTVDVLGEIQSELNALECGLTQRRQDANMPIRCELPGESLFV